jgi:hypothetical protein
LSHKSGAHWRQRLAYKHTEASKGIDHTYDTFSIQAYRGKKIDTSHISYLSLRRVWAKLTTVGSQASVRGGGASERALRSQRAAAS